MKQCLVCKKPIRWPKRRYCCRACQRIGSVLELGVKNEPKQKEVELLFARWKKTFGKNSERVKKKDAWAFRIFVWSSIEVLGYPEKMVADTCGKDHSTIFHHLQSIRWNEKIEAENFARNKQYEFTKLRIYPPDFKYIDIDKK